jgi:hypothetical protein
MDKTVVQLIADVKRWEDLVRACFKREPTQDERFCYLLGRLDGIREHERKATK